MRLFALLILFVLTSCGYHLRSQRPVEVFVPYVAGDLEGIFTATLIHELSTRSNLDYSCEGNFCLKVCLLEPSEENIGFKFAPEKNGGLSRILSPEESRLSLSAQCSLTDRNTGCTIFGPFLVTATYTYDFESDFSTANIHRFSLSQLEMHTLAKDEAFTPLYQLLAQKIIDTLVASL
jgi:hypothetical protein